MKRVLAKKLPSHFDKRVLLRGWMNSFRSLGKLGFLLPPEDEQLDPPAKRRKLND